MGRDTPLLLCAAKWKEKRKGYCSSNRIRVRTEIELGTLIARTAFAEGKSVECLVLSALITIYHLLGGSSLSETKNRRKEGRKEGRINLSQRPVNAMCYAMVRYMMLPKRIPMILKTV